MSSQITTTQESLKIPLSRTDIYHKDIGFPKSLKIPNLFFKLHYTDHALTRHSDRCIDLEKLPNIVRVYDGNIVEIHTKNNAKIKKVVIRIPYNDEDDLILVLQLIIRKKPVARVITIYLNKKEDKHTTLKKNKYNIPEAA